MATERLREHLEWHLRRLKGARAAAAELSLRAETDGLQWLTLTHFAVLALEATLAEEIAADHKALEEVMADVAGLPSAAAEAPAPQTRPAHDDHPALADSWASALASFQAFAFPWRPPPRRPLSAAQPPGRDSNLRAR